jgi:hypothetical protein
MEEGLNFLKFLGDNQTWISKNKIKTENTTDG